MHPTQQQVNIYASQMSESFNGWIYFWLFIFPCLPFIKDWKFKQERMNDWCKGKTHSMYCHSISASNLLSRDQGKLSCESEISHFPC